MPNAFANTYIRRLKIFTFFLRMKNFGFFFSYLPRMKKYMTKHGFLPRFTHICLWLFYFITKKVILFFIKGKILHIWKMWILYHFRDTLQVDKIWIMYFFNWYYDFSLILRREDSWRSGQHLTRLVVKYE